MRRRYGRDQGIVGIAKVRLESNVCKKKLIIVVIKIHN